ncbi:MAG: hypothetical protein KAT93_07705 [Desulfuromonadales bacterium]|jgi:hypothetical protein|nr:hypothetical protein [Desulfuromonadales bacterium]
MLNIYPVKYWNYKQNNCATEVAEQALGNTRMVLVFCIKLLSACSAFPARDAFDFKNKKPAHARSLCSLEDAEIAEQALIKTKKIWVQFKALSK